MSQLTLLEQDRSARVQRHLAYESLRAVLRLGRIPGGQRLREPEWSQRLGVNRSALREALARLLSEGLVVEGDRGGYFVPSLAEEEVREIIELRLTLESKAIEHILRGQRNRLKAFRELGKICDEQEWMIRRGYTAELPEADQLFHEKLIELGGGRRLRLFHRALPQPPIPLECMDRVRGRCIWEQMLAQHRAVLAAVQAGQCDQAKAILQEHYVMSEVRRSK